MCVGRTAYQVALNTGWECPKCHAVMAPTTPSCLYCVPLTTKTVYQVSGNKYDQMNDTISLLYRSMTNGFYY